MTLEQAAKEIHDALGQLLDAIVKTNKTTKDERDYAFAFNQASSAWNKYAMLAAQTEQETKQGLDERYEARYFEPQSDRQLQANAIAAWLTELQNTWASETAKWFVGDTKYIVFPDSGITVIVYCFQEK